MGKADQINVANYRPKIAATQLFLKILKKRKNFNLFHERLLVLSLVLFEDHPNFEAFFSSKEDIRLFWLARAALDDHLLLKELNFPFLFSLSLFILTGLLLVLLVRFLVYFRWSFIKFIHTYFLNKSLIQ